MMRLLRRNEWSDRGARLLFWFSFSPHAAAVMAAAAVVAVAALAAAPGDRPAPARERAGRRWPARVDRRAAAPARAAAAPARVAGAGLVLVVRQPRARAARRTPGRVGRRAV